MAQVVNNGLVDNNGLVVNNVLVSFVFLVIMLVNTGVKVSQYGQKFKLAKKSKIASAIQDQVSINDKLTNCKTDKLSS